jgi:thiol-disulfide isomerase/thioredoxin
MVFLKVNEENDDKIKKFKQYYSSPAKIFMLIYMNGCGPCNATKPEWAKLENVLKKYADDNNVVIVDMDKDLLPKLELKDFKEPVGFPTIVKIHNKKQKSYEDSPHLLDEEKDRSVDSFVKWIEKELKNGEMGEKQNGGKTRKTRRHKKYNKKGGKWSRKYKRSINCKRPRGFSQKQYCKYGRKN